MAFQCYACGLCFHVGDSHYTLRAWHRRDGDGPGARIADCYYAVCQSCGTLHGVEHGKRNQEDGTAPPYRLCARSGPVFRNLSLREITAYQKRKKRRERVRQKEERYAKFTEKFLSPTAKSVCESAGCLLWWIVMLPSFGFHLLKGEIVGRLLPPRMTTQEEINQREEEQAQALRTYESQWPIIRWLVAPNLMQHNRDEQGPIQEAIEESKAYRIEEESIFPTLSCTYCGAGPNALVFSYEDSFPCPHCHQYKLEEEDIQSDFSVTKYTCGDVFLEGWFR